MIQHRLAVITMFVALYPALLLAASSQDPPAYRSACTNSGPIQFRISEPVSNKLLVKKVEAVYPPDASGDATVTLWVVINRQGRSRSICAEAGNEAFMQAAVNAVKLWRWRPYLVNGEPAESETLIHIEFHAK